METATFILALASIFLSLVSWFFTVMAYRELEASEARTRRIMAQIEGWNGKLTRIVGGAEKLGKR